MTKRKSTNTENPRTLGKGKRIQSYDDREKKIMNSIVNTSVILMGTMMGSFAEVMVKATGVMASGVAEAIDGEGGEKISKEFAEKLPKVDEKMKTMISDMRKEVYAQLGQKKIRPPLSDPAYDAGPKIIEKYDFGLPELTEELSDNELAQYTQLLVSEDPSFVEMFKKLTDWMNALPKFPDKTNK